MSQNIRYNLFSIFASTLIALGIWIYLLYNFNPFTSDILTRASFFASLFFWLSGFIAMIIIFLRINFKPKGSVKESIVASIRHGSILGTLIVGLLVLKSLDVLNLWQGIILVIIAGLMELFFRASSQP